MSRPVRAIIDRQALQHNLARARQLAHPARVMAVIKADGYGHGIIPVAESLAQADAFAVARVSEGEALRAHGIDKSICLLSGLVSGADVDASARHRLEPVVHCREQLDLLQANGRSAGLTVWLKVDSGMHRLGFAPDDLPAVFERLARLPVAGLRVMSHFANADDRQDRYTQIQLERFLKLVHGRGLPASLANSAGVVAWPDSHLDWVRPGIMLYGCTPLLECDEQALDLRPAMTLAAPVIAVKSVARGEPVGYGGTWHAGRDTRIAVVGCGYGDGYPRHAPSGTPVWLGGRRVPLVGRVSMDMLTVELPAGMSVQVGAEAELWGSSVRASEVARAAETISYELTCGITARVARELIG